jgi:hypothetical protein
MGQTTDPEDGAAVAYSIYIAVAVYGVRQVPLDVLSVRTNLLLIFRHSLSSAAYKPISMSGTVDGVKYRCGKRISGQWVGKRQDRC